MFIFYLNVFWSIKDWQTNRQMYRKCDSITFISLKTKANRLNTEFPMDLHNQTINERKDSGIKFSLKFSKLFLYFSSGAPNHYLSFFLCSLVIKNNSLIYRPHEVMEIQPLILLCYRMFLLLLLNWKQYQVCLSTLRFL